MKNESKFRGKNLWHQINLVIFFIGYAIMFIVPIFFPDYIWHVVIAFAFIIILYVAIQQYVFRTIERKNAGTRVWTGWLDIMSGIGEEIEIPIKEIRAYTSASVEERGKIESIQDIIEGYKKESEDKKLKKGIDSFRKLENKQNEEEYEDEILEEPIE